MNKILTQQTDGYIKVCMNTWLLCEACIHMEKGKSFPRQNLLEACHNCAQSCLSVASQFITNPLLLQNKCMECLQFCRKCYHECMLYNDDDIYRCGEACSDCANQIKMIMNIQLN